MNLKNKRPIFVPPQHVAEFEKLSKAALMDMVWDYAEQMAGGDTAVPALTGEAVMAEFRKRREIVLTYRRQGG